MIIYNTEIRLRALYGEVHPPPQGQGRFIKIADPSVCPTRGDFFFEGRLVIRTHRQAIRQTLASVLREGTQRPSLGGGDFPVDVSNFEPTQRVFYFLALFLH